MACSTDLIYFGKQLSQPSNEITCVAATHHFIEVFVFFNKASNFYLFISRATGATNITFLKDNIGNVIFKNFYFVFIIWGWDETGFLCVTTVLSVLELTV